MNKIFVSQHREDKSVQNIMHEQSTIRYACERYFKSEDSEFSYSVEKEDSTPQDLANAIKALVNADMLVLGDGWQRGREGRTLYVAAQIYNIPIFTLNCNDRLMCVQHAVIVKLKNKDPIFMVRTLHLDIDGNYVVHIGRNSDNDEITRFSENDVELIIM